MGYQWGVDWRYRGCDLKVNWQVIPSATCSLSVVVPTWNRKSVLSETLRSAVPGLDRASAEVIVVDDGSEDGTWEWLQSEFGPKHPTVRIVRCDENAGPGPARNVGLKLARGKYFLPLDSDVLLLDGALDRVFAAIRLFPQRHVLFFPCIQSPALRRMDSLVGQREITHEDLLYGRIRGELIPVANLEYFRANGLQFPPLRAGGEGILWIRALREQPALFIDQPLVLYRTDVPGRICTAEYQINHAAEVAAVADAMIGLFPPELIPEARRGKGSRLMASGTYHLLAGNCVLARRRLLEALRMGNVRALPILLASLLGRSICQCAFAAFRPDPSRAASSAASSIQ